MPTYEYKCDTCGHRFEKFQSMNDELLKVCPECGRVVKRLFGKGAGVIFKGNGFHGKNYKQQSSSRIRCGKDTTCCGRDVPCDKPPCGD